MYIDSPVYQYLILIVMKCPFCTSSLSKVLDKRTVLGRGEIRRRRECLKCGKRYTTYEHLAELKILVIKKDGRREPFIEEKLRLGLLKSLQKRPGLDKVPRLVDRIENRIKERGLSEVSSEKLGEWVLTELKRLDPIAYLRFASVYRSFGDPKDFAREMKALI